MNIPTLFFRRGRSHFPANLFIAAMLLMSTSSVLALGESYEFKVLLKARRPGDSNIQPPDVYTHIMLEAKLIDPRTDGSANCGSVPFSMTMAELEEPKELPIPILETKSGIVVASKVLSGEKSSEDVLDEGVLYPEDVLMQSVEPDFDETTPILLKLKTSRDLASCFEFVTLKLLKFRSSKNKIRL